MHWYAVNITDWHIDLSETAVDIRRRLLLDILSETAVVIAEINKCSAGNKYMYLFVSTLS